jgi:MOSC domain-containing protein YiiM
MWRGSVLAILVRPEINQPVMTKNVVRAVPGAGLEGDYALSSPGEGKTGPDREVTLLEVEALEALKREKGIKLTFEQSRRNILTRSVPLNHLVGKKFQVGEVVLRGIRLCEPCKKLAQNTQPEVLPALIHRGGLRAEILTEGLLQVGDPIFPLEETEGQE